MEYIPGKLGNELGVFCRTQAQANQLGHQQVCCSSGSVISSGSNPEEYYKEGKGIIGGQCQPAHILNIRNWDSKSTKRGFSGEGVSVKGEGGLKRKDV